MENKYQDVFEALDKGYFKIDKEKYFENLDKAQERKIYGENNVVKEFYIPVKSTISKTIYGNVIVKAPNFIEAMRIFHHTPELYLDIYDPSVYEDDEWEEPYKYNEKGDHFFSIDGKGIRFHPEEEMNKITGMEKIDFKHVEGQKLIWREMN